MKKSFLILTISLVSFKGFAQNENDEIFQLNTITTAVPFLGIGPDSRSGGMGDVGVALNGDANSVHWNPAQLGFLQNELEVCMNFTPWLRKLVKDINLSYLSFAYRIDKNQGVAGGLRYFTLGNITFTDAFGTVIRDFKPSEFALDFAYGRLLGEKFSGGMSARFIYSNLTGGVPVGGANTKPGMSGAVDIGMLYRDSDIKLGKSDGTLSIGLNISNVGAKISYATSTQKDFLPTNLRLGGALEVRPDVYNKFTMALDFNKLLVPTPPLYDPAKPQTIYAGRDRTELGVAAGMFGSFTDAPGYFVYDESGKIVKDDNGNPEIEKGSKFREELREINIATGVEWWYAKQFALRMGYFHEHITKGARQYFTFGAGVKYSKFQLDVSYLVSVRQNNPLAGTLRFSLRFVLDKINNQATPAEG